MIPIFQSKVGECGLASLAMIASNYGYFTDLATLQKKFPSEKNFITLAELMEYAVALRLKSRALRVPPDHVKKLKAPCILHWDRNRFVVLREVKRNLFGRASLVLIDPASGEYEISLTDALSHFSGVALELSPDAAFVPRDERVEADVNSEMINENVSVVSSLNRNWVYAFLTLILASLVFSKFPSLIFDQGITNTTKLIALAFLTVFFIIFIIRLKITSLKNNHEFGLGRGLEFLSNGQFEKGWQLYEKRWKTPLGRMSKRKFERPAWRGNESLRAMRILIYAEQGLGDTIHFCRYLPMVADLGATVYFEVQEPLESLLHDFKGVAKIIRVGTPLPEFDFHCPLLSLPGIFKTNMKSIPSQFSYLSSKKEDVERWMLRLGAPSKKRIGLVWSGNASHSNDHNRSMPLALLNVLISELPDIEFFSLQRDVSSVDQDTLDALPRISHFGHQLRNFADTAALCELMDCIISVDTSVAHLSAALGKTTFIMLPFTPDWRWLKGRADSPWYPTVTLIRQKKAGDWNGVLARVKHEIELNFIQK